MTAIRTTKDGITGIQCNTVCCSSHILVPPCGSMLKAREFTGRYGWSTPAGSRQALGSAHLADYCPKCTMERDKRARVCKRCPGGELFELFGHSRAGHLAARALYRYDAYLTADQVALFTRDELLDIPSINHHTADAILGAITAVYGPPPRHPQRPKVAQTQIFHTLDRAQQSVRTLLDCLPAQPSVWRRLDEKDLRDFAGDFAQHLHTTAVAIGKTLAASQP